MLPDGEESDSHVRIIAFPLRFNVYSLHNYTQLELCDQVTDDRAQWILKNPDIKSTAPESSPASYVVALHQNDPIPAPQTPASTYFSEPYVIVVDSSSPAAVISFPDIYMATTFFKQMEGRRILVDRRHPHDVSELIFYMPSPDHNSL
jgi:hypothetical protein